jgi:hypothetical protein
MVIKREVNFKQSKIAEFCERMEKVLGQMKRGCESAVINRDPYRLTDEHETLQVPHEKWFTMNVRQRENNLKRLWAYAPSQETSIEVAVASASILHEMATTTNMDKKLLSIAPEDSGVTGVALLSDRNVQTGAAAA